MTNDAAKAMLYDQNTPVLEQRAQSDCAVNIHVTAYTEENNDIVLVIISTKEGPTALLCSKHVLPQIINAFVGQRA